MREYSDSDILLFFFVIWCLPFLLFISDFGSTNNFFPISTPLLFTMPQTYWIFFKSIFFYCFTIRHALKNLFFSTPFERYCTYLPRISLSCSVLTLAFIFLMGISLPFDLLWNLVF